MLLPAVRAMLLPAAFLLSASLAATGVTGSIIINEVMASNKGAAAFSDAVSKAISFSSDDGKPDIPANPSWVELKNTGPSAADLGGWHLKTHDADITLPKMTLQADGLLLILAEGKNAKNKASTGSDNSNGSTSVGAAQVLVAAYDGPAPGTQPLGAPNTVPILSASFSLPDNGTKLGQLSVIDPSGRTVDTLGWVPRQQVNVSWGYPGPGTAAAAGQQIAGRTFLETATPGAPNSGPAKLGPHIVSVTDTVAAVPGQPIVVEITVVPNLAPVSKVSLLYRIGFEPEQTVTASLVRQETEAAYQATIPSSAFKAGDLVRWAAQAEDTAGYVSRVPVGLKPGSVEKQAGNTATWLGTVVGGVQDPDITPQSTVPVLEWFTQAPDQSMTPAGAGNSIFYFKGRLYDGVYVHRRGMSSLAWRKPKLKVELPTGHLFTYDDNHPPVAQFGLQSHFYELGERSYMKDSIGLKVLADAGVPTPDTFYVHMRLNGNFFGLFSWVEEIDKTFLRRNDIPVGGPLFKSENGELSNLRWDISPTDMPTFYSLKYPRDANTNPKLGPKSKQYPGSNEWQVLSALTKGLAGGGPEKRSAFVMDQLHIPELINLLAVQVILNNQDRCTKNFYMYLNPDTNRWMMLPWDLDAALGQDNGLGGRPGDKYCVLGCEQWNSPLYCDSEHTQDLQRVTPWGTITVKMDDPYTGGGAAPVSVPGGKRRALLQANPNQGTDARLTRFAQSPAKPLNERPPTVVERLLIMPKTYPKPQGWDNPDRDTTSQASPLGAAGTYNHLVDAITDVAITRAMMMRRIRTLTEVYLGPNGKIVQMANATYPIIRSLALRDAKFWQTGINIDEGYTQIITEYAPVREYLLLSVYGLNGSYPLIPGPQPPFATSGLLAKSVAVPPAPASNTSQLSWQAQISNPANGTAMDISHWQLKGPPESVTFKLPPGTVIPNGTTLNVVPDMAAFTQRHRGEGLFMVGPLKRKSSKKAGLDGVQLVDAAGNPVATLSTT